MSFNYIAQKAVNWYIDHYKRRKPVYRAPKPFPWKKASQGVISAIGAAAT